MSCITHTTKQNAYQFVSSQSAFDRWLQGKEPEFVYFRGYLPVARTMDAAQTFQPVKMIAEEMANAARAGVVAITQRRKGFFDYEYIAQRL